MLVTKHSKLFIRALYLLLTIVLGYGVSNSLIKLIWYKIEQLVHRFTPIFKGDMGWITSTHRRWVNMLRLVSMDISRRTIIVFEYDHGFTGVRILRKY